MVVAAVARGSLMVEEEGSRSKTRPSLLNPTSTASASVLRLLRNQRFEGLLAEEMEERWRSI